MRQKTSNRKKTMSVGKKRFLSVLLAVLFTGFLTCVIIGSYVLYDVISTVNGERLIDLDFYKQNQDQTTIIYAYDAENNPVELTRLHGEENRVWVGRDEMSPWIGKAFVAIEDKRFEKHSGVDWVSTVKVVTVERFGRGGSTITQQLIKNLTGENGRTFNRKYNEILSALNLEKYYDKEVILEAYLNTIYLSHGCYGVKTAAETYFGKDISELNIAECAALAAITQEPGKYDPLWNPSKNKERQELVLWNMYDQNMITKEQYDEAVAYELIFTNSDKYVEKDTDKDKETSSKNDIQSYYVDYVISCVIRDLKAAGYSSYEANKMIYSGGLRIYSAVDTAVQEIVEDVYEHRKNFPSERVGADGKPMQSAMTIMDYKGRVVAIVGGAGEKTTNRSNNRAVSAIRQPGSSIKPLSIYAPAIEGNYITWSSKIKNYGIMWDGEIWPKNYGHNAGGANSYVTAQYALQQSYNTVPAQLLMMMGFDTSYNFVTDKFHITTLNEKIDRYIPSPLATGGTTGGVTTLQMTAAFAAFGNGGKYYKPYSYYKVTDSTGENIILQSNPDADCEQIMSPETAYIMNEMMRTVMTQGTGRGCGVKGFTTFGKTGTSGTSDDSYDRWCVAGTPYYVSAVWFGYDTQKVLHVSGNPAGSIYKTVMDRIHKNLAPKSFETYTDQVVQRTYCTVSGLLAGDGCYSKGTGWYKASNLPATCASCNGAPPPTEPESTTGTGENPPAPPTEGTTAAPPVEEPVAPPVEAPQNQAGTTQ